MLFFSKDEAVFEQYETVDYIYFIFTGSVKLYVDIEEWVIDRPEIANLTEQGYKYEKPGIVCVIKYIERGHVGDNDVFAELEGKCISALCGYDSTAVVDDRYSTFFTYPKTKLQNIQLLFPKQYAQMRKQAMEKHQYHVDLIN